MAKPTGGKFRTVIVTYSWSVARPDGSTALLLDTEEEGRIAFRVNQRAIDLIRRQLTDCETVLSRTSAHVQ